MAKPTTKYIQCVAPEDLHERAKLEAVRLKITMPALVIRALEKFLPKRKGASRG